MQGGTRLPGLDGLRGIAILMIIFANIEFMAYGIFGPMMHTGTYVVHESPWVDGVLAAFVNGKFRSLLMIVFGVGIALQYRAVGATGAGWIGRRYAWLLAFGMLHAALLWSGDILFLYAILGMVSLLFLRASDESLAKGLKWTIGIGAAGGLLLGGLFGVIDLMGTEEVSKMFAKELAAERVAANGSYLAGVLFRLKQLPLGLSNGVVFVGLVLPLVLGGISAVRTGLLQPTDEAHARRRKFMRTLLLIGLPLNLGALLFVRTGVPMGLEGLIEGVTAPILSAGVFLWLMDLAIRGRWQPRLLATIGKMALTCYLLQSLLGLILVSSWGFGRYEKLAGPNVLLAAAGISLLSGLIVLLLSRFTKIGPVEWLWRRVSGTLEKPRTPPIQFQV